MDAGLNWCVRGRTEMSRLEMYFKGGFREPSGGLYVRGKERSFWSNCVDDGVMYCDGRQLG